MLKFGIMGGTFDPVHIGHLIAAEEAKEQFGLDRVLFIPTGNPPHKRETIVSATEDRYHMVQLAIEANESFKISSMEINRDGPTYAIDTLQDLTRLYPETLFYFITGADAVLQILSWKDIDKVIELCFFIAVTRPGYDITRMNQVLQNLNPEQRKKFHFLSIPSIAVSSTEIRERVKKGNSIKYLVPAKVEAYIHNHQLYL